MRIDSTGAGGGDSKRGARKAGRGRSAGKRTHLALAATLFAATAVVAGSGAGAGADDRATALERAAASCPVGDVCFWPQPNFGGQVQVWHNPWARTCDWVLARPARSLYNNDNDTWSFYSDANCKTSVVTLSKGQSAADVTVQTWQ